MEEKLITIAPIPESQALNVPFLDITHPPWMIYTNLLPHVNHDFDTCALGPKPASDAFKHLSGKQVAPFPQ
jgi:hypothetical protein